LDQNRIISAARINMPISSGDPEPIVGSRPRRSETQAGMGAWFFHLHHRRPTLTFLDLGVHLNIPSSPSIHCR
jgi:hypothetical protein